MFDHELVHGTPHCFFVLYILYADVLKLCSQLRDIFDLEEDIY